MCSRRINVNDRIASEIPGIEFHKTRQMNESDLVSVNDVRDAALQITAASHYRNTETDMKTLFEVSIIQWQVITKSERWKFSGN